MRIIAGVAKGRRLASPKGRSLTRPMTDRAKEGLFSSLGPKVSRSAVLDLYAGTGSLGLEALSRGAAIAIFVENEPEALVALRKNIDTVGLGGTVVAAPVETFAWRSDRPHDVVFVDPPYALPLASVEDVVMQLEPQLAAGAAVVVHRRRGGDQPAMPQSVTLQARRTYGDVELWRYVKEET